MYPAESAYRSNKRNTISQSSEPQYLNQASHNISIKRASSQVKEICSSANWTLMTISTFPQITSALANVSDEQNDLKNLTKSYGSISK
ncbi:unnamed protein product [Sympodiomycopsis kandeliae]